MYILRSILACSLALGLSYLLQLDAPYSAATTVTYVLNPNQGAEIGKGAWRLIGTLAGLLVSFALVAAFAQMPLLFILGFGFWLGICVAGTTLFRHFRASGIVVAGYTIGLATHGALQHPELTFDRVMGRGSAVGVGVISLGLVSSLLSSRRMRGKIETQFSKLTSSVAYAISSQRGVGLSDPTKVLMSEIYVVDDLLALGKAESEDLAQRATAVRKGMDALFMALVGGAAPLPENSESSRALAQLKPPLEHYWHEASQAMKNGTIGLPKAHVVLSSAKKLVTNYLQDTVIQNETQKAALLVAGERLIEQLDAYCDALGGLEALVSTLPPAREAAVSFDRDYVAAAKNGLRAMLVVITGGIVWLATDWNYGDVMLMMAATYCAVLAASLDPLPGTWGFVKGTILAVPAALICKFGFLQLVNGFPLLILTLSVFWVPGIYATSKPKTAAAGMAYLGGFNTLVAATNPIHFNFADFLNQSVAWVLGPTLAYLSFRLFLPKDIEREAIRLQRRIRRDTIRLIKETTLDSVSWQQRQQHRLSQLGALLKGKPETIDKPLAQALAAIHVGYEISRIRKTMLIDSLPDSVRRCACTGLRYMSKSASKPGITSHQARRTAKILARFAKNYPEQRHNVHKIAAAFSDIYWLIHAHTDYFDGVSH
ncbi:FUSC family protein [Caballeronia sp. LZ043]|uniref:FUSC family protein n=1 Tax=Caballeronia sp. LZ043 TaxID=3038569 RepID=UPI003857B832